MNSPCYNCPDRHYKCHGHCEKYADYRRIRDERIKANHERAEFNSYKYENVPRLKRASVSKMFRSTKK